MFTSALQRASTNMIFFIERINWFVVFFWMKTSSTIHSNMYPFGDYLRIGDYAFALPSTQEILNGSLYHNNVLRRLLKLKQDVLTEIAGYTTFKEGTITAEQKKWLQRFLMRGIIPGVESESKLTLIEE